MSRPDDPLLPPGSVDVAFLCDTVHEIGGRVDYYRKVYRALKARGRLAVIEHAGFRLVAEPKFLPRQCFLIFQRAK